MAVQIYTYEAHFDWKWHKNVNAWEIPDRPTVEAQLKADFQTAFLAEFAAKIAAAGHWYKMDRVETTITKYSGTWGFPLPLPISFNIDVEGTTTIFFETDIKDATAHASPQLWQVIKDCIYSVIHWLALHPSVVVVLLATGFLTILYIMLVNTTTGAISKLGEEPGSIIIVLGILGALVAYFYYSSKSRKRSRK